jgi:hypothetical protein
MPERATRKRSEKSAEVVVAAQAAKDQTKRRATRLWVSEVQGLRCPGNWSYR